jgi:hypothetical protein
MNILQALDDQQVFAPHLRGNSWESGRVFLQALFGLPMNEQQLAIYQQFTGRTTPPATPLHEAWLIVRRRGGKSFVLALTAVFLACFKDWRKFLGPGEMGTIMIIAKDRPQARVIKRFITGLLHETPMLQQVIEEETRERIQLRNRVIIEIHTASFRSTRGYTIIAALLDEVSIWPTDESSAEPDIEVINAIKPGMATIPDAILLCASSPHARKGALWEAHRKHYGQEGDPILIWQADTRSMNATVPQSYIDQHVADDPARAAAEYGAIFRSDLENFISREIVLACLGDYHEIRPSRDHTYRCFVDPASGIGEDSFALAISHRHGDDVVVDCVREIKPPFSPQAAISELAALAKSYPGVDKVVGDHYGGEFPRELFFKAGGLNYETSKHYKSDLYRELLPLLNSKRIVLPKHDRLINQIVGLERKVARGGSDSIDHPARAGCHDDISNAVAGAAFLALSYDGYLYDSSYRGWQDNPAEPASVEALIRQQQQEKYRRELMQKFGQPVSLLRSQ